MNTEVTIANHYDHETNRIAKAYILPIWKVTDIYYHGVRDGKAVFSTGSMSEDRECVELPLEPGDMIHIRLLGE